MPQFTENKPDVLPAITNHYKSASKQNDYGMEITFDYSELKNNSSSILQMNHYPSQFLNKSVLKLHKKNQ